MRPFPSNEEDEVVDYEVENDTPSVFVMPKGQDGKATLKILTSQYFKSTYRNYQFENVFSEESTQTQIFDECGKEMCEKFIQGKNCNIIVYGPTSTGKTYTMQGNISSKIKESQIKFMFD